MKPFLGIDLTVDKKNKEYNGKEFLVQEPSEALSSSLEASNEKLDETIKKARLPLPLRILELVCGFGALSVIAGFFKSGASLSEALKNAPQLFWLPLSGLFCGFLAEKG